MVPQMSKQSRMVHKRLTFSIAPSPHAFERCLYRSMTHLQVVSQLSNRSERAVTIAPLTVMDPVPSLLALPIQVSCHPLSRALPRLLLPAHPHVITPGNIAVTTITAAANDTSTASHKRRQ